MQWKNSVFIIILCGVRCKATTQSIVPGLYGAVCVYRPDGYTYNEFRAQFVVFSIYLSKSYHC